MKKAMFLGLVLSVVSLGSVMANDAYAPLDGKPKKVVINVNMPPAGGCVEHFNPGGFPPPPPVGVCNCHKDTSSTRLTSVTIMHQRHAQARSLTRATTHTSMVSQAALQTVYHTEALVVLHTASQVADNNSKRRVLGD